MHREKRKQYYYYPTAFLVHFVMTGLQTEWLQVGLWSKIKSVAT
jgi:hypothetical protein